MELAERGFGASMVGDGEGNVLGVEFPSPKEYTELVTRVGGVLGLPDKVEASRASAYPVVAETKWRSTTLPSSKGWRYAVASGPTNRLSSSGNGYRASPHLSNTTRAQPLDPGVLGMRSAAWNVLGQTLSGSL